MDGSVRRTFYARHRTAGDTLGAAADGADRSVGQPVLVLWAT